MTIIYRNIHCLINYNLDDFLTSSDRGSLRPMKTAIVEVDHNTVTGKLMLQVDVKGESEPTRTEITPSVFSDGFITIPKRLMSLDEVYHKVSTLGTEADQRSLSLSLYHNSKFKQRTFVFVHRHPSSLNLGPDYRPNMVAYEKFQNNRQALSDWLTEHEFQHTFD